MRKVFEADDLVLAAVGLWWEQMQFPLVRQGQAVLGVSKQSLWSWRFGQGKPDSTAIKHMIHLTVWQRQGWPAACFESIDWDAMEVEYADHDHEHLPSPFYLEPPIPDRGFPGRKFAFGSRQDIASITKAILDQGVESRAHLIALLGMPAAQGGAYGHVKRWVRGEQRIGPQYLMRKLILLLWDAEPDRFAALSDLWAVDWKTREVEYTKRFMRSWNATHNVWDGPPSPFFRFMDYATPPDGRRSDGEWWPPPAPVRTYDPADYLNGANGAQRIPVEAAST